jgi:thiamine transport system substrate-binding protein
VRGRRLTALLAVAASLAAGCGDDDADDRGADSTTITLVTHDSFNVTTSVLDAFTEETGIQVELLRGGDAGTVVNQAILTRDHPQGDVLFGIDNTFLTRGLDADLFLPYESPSLDAVDDAFVLDDRHRVTPVDYADVCVNYDREFFGRPDAPPLPSSIDQLVEPAYRNLLAVENPATSSPGLAFLLATIDRFGEEGWAEYWRALRANEVAVTDGWEDAYYGLFSGGGGSEGDRPLVVSYASSPPAEVVFADPPIDEAPTGVIDDGCFRQVEMAGILRGTDDEAAARTFVDFLLSAPFQEDVPLSMFVFPVRRGTPLPEVFERHAARPDDPAQLDAAEIGAHRDEWIAEWTDVVLR